MDLRVVVLAELDFLLRGPRAERHLDIGVGILGANHETDLARRVGRDGGVGVLGDREDLLAVLLELGDEGQVKPLVLSCGRIVLAKRSPSSRKRYKSRMPPGHDAKRYMSTKKTTTR